MIGVHSGSLRDTSWLRLLELQPALKALAAGIGVSSVTCASAVRCWTPMPPARKTTMIRAATLIRIHANRFIDFSSVYSRAHLSSSGLLSALHPAGMGA